MDRCRCDRAVEPCGVRERSPRAAACGWPSVTLFALPIAVSAEQFRIVGAKDRGLIDRVGLVQRPYESQDPRSHHNQVASVQSLVTALSLGVRLIRIGPRDHFAEEAGGWCAAPQA